MEKLFTVDDLKENNSRLNEVIVYDDYMNLAEKITYSNIIIDKCIEQNKIGYVDVNYVLLDILLLLYQVEMYTNISIKNYSISEYDFLKKNNIDEKLGSNNDVQEFENVVLNMVLSQKEHNSIEMILSKTSESFIELMEDIGEHINKMLDKGDPNKVAKYLSKGVEMMAKKMPDMSQFDVQTYLENVKKNKDMKDTEVNNRNDFN